MANSVILLNSSNTFNDWLDSTNKLTVESNVLDSQLYIKPTGTLFLNDPVFGLQVGSNSIFAGNVTFNGTSNSIYNQNNLLINNNLSTKNIFLKNNLYANGSGILISNNFNVSGSLTTQNMFIKNNLYANGSGISLNVNKNFNVNNSININNLYTNIMNANVFSVNTFSGDLNFTGTQYSFGGYARYLLFENLTINTNTFTHVLSIQKGTFYANNIYFSYAESFGNTYYNSSNTVFVKTNPFVTIHSPTGTITANLTMAPFSSATFTFYNKYISANDVVILCHLTGSIIVKSFIERVGNGFCNITLRNVTDYGAVMDATTYINYFVFSTSL